MNIIIIIGIIIIILLLVICYNGIIKAKNEVDKCFSNMDVMLKKRWDLVPNLIESVKEYMRHEEETLTKIINIRKKDYNKLNDDEKVNVDKDLSDSMYNLNVLSESYPNLKANENFIELKRQLRIIEEDISVSRTIYNSSVTNYNNKISIFPLNLFAKILGFKEKKLYIIDNKERENVKIKFN